CRAGGRDPAARCRPVGGGRRRAGHRGRSVCCHPATSGWRPRDGDILAPPGDRAPALLRNRYIRLWIFRHRHFPAKQLIATLVEAVDIARDRNQDTVLPELSPD